jgi:TrmH family RNA methyltransferase
MLLVCKVLMMTELNHITSLQNPRIKAVVKLRQAKARKSSQTFLIEGARELDRALTSGYKVSECYYCETLLSEDGMAAYKKIAGSPDVYSTTELVYSKIAMREKSDGIVAVLQKKDHSLNILQGSKAKFILIVDGVEKPGNLGALLRTADGAGVDAVMVVGNSVDIYGPQVVRSSLGTLFSLRVVCADEQQVADYIEEKQIPLVSVTPHATHNYDGSDYSSGAALILGSEAWGVSKFWDDKVDEKVLIPMKGIADSLNVSVAGAIVLYEVERQMRIHSLS